MGCANRRHSLHKSYKLKTAKLLFGLMIVPVAWRHRLLLALSVTCCLGLSQKIANAGPIGPSIRPVTSNNIYECRTGRAFEIIQGNSNIHNTSGAFSLICLNPDNTARWVINSGISCEEEACPQARTREFFGVWDNRSATVQRTPVPSAVSGMDCRWETNSSGERSRTGWSCQRVVTHDAMTITTTSPTERMHISNFLARFSDLSQDMIYHSSIVPVNQTQENQLRTHRSTCYGSANFCR